MRVPLLAAAALLACAGCTTGPVPTAAAPNGDVTRRVQSAPDTPTNKAPKPGFRDNAVDTDPSSPRTQDRGQKILVPPGAAGQ